MNEISTQGTITLEKLSAVTVSVVRGTDAVVLAITNAEDHIVYFETTANELSRLAKQLTADGMILLAPATSAQ